MDQGPLVEDEIVDGRRFLERFAADGHAIRGAAWIKTAEEGLWFLYVVTETYDSAGPSAAYRAVHDSLEKLDDVLFPGSRIRLLGVNNLVSFDLMSLASAHPKRSGFPFDTDELGYMPVSQVYVYSAWVFESIRPGSMTVDDLGQEILRRLMSGPNSGAARVTLKDGTSFSGVPLTLHQGDRDTMRVQFDAGQEAPRIYPISAIDSIR